MKRFIFFARYAREEFDKNLSRSSLTAMHAAGIRRVGMIRDRVHQYLSR